MHSRPKVPLPGIAFLVATLTLVAGPGCSVVGEVVGNALDRRGLVPVDHTEELASTALPGDSVIVVSHRGDTLGGRYAGVRELSPSQYWPLYLDDRRHLAESLPLPDRDELIDVTAGQRVSRGRFRGISRKVFLVHDPMARRTTGIPVDSITVMTLGNGTQIRGTAFVRHLEEGKIRTRVATQFATDGDTMSIADETMAAAAIYYPATGGRETLTAFGAVIDIMALSALVVLVVAGRGFTMPPLGL